MGVMTRLLAVLCACVVESVSSRRGGSHGNEDHPPAWSKGHTAHGIVMLIVFMLVAIPGIMIATRSRMANSVPSRYFQQHEGQKEYQKHRGAMITVIALALVGLILGVLGTPGDKHFQSAHGVFGLFIFFFMIAQATMGALFGRLAFLPNDTDRTCHRVWGRLIMIMATAQVAMGCIEMDWHWATVAVALPVVATAIFSTFIPHKAGNEEQPSKLEVSSSQATCHALSVTTEDIGITPQPPAERSLFK